LAAAQFCWLHDDSVNIVRQPVQSGIATKQFLVQSFHAFAAFCPRCAAYRGSLHAVC
jgi:hypothetical protein